MTLSPRPDAGRSVSVIRSDIEALETARRLAASIAGSAARNDRERILPRDEVAAFFEAGLGGILIPRRYGGAGVSAATLAKVFAIVSEADPSVGQIPQNHTAFLELLRNSADEAQIRRIYGLVLQGKQFGNALAERHGKTTRDIATRLEETATGAVLNGQKFYATGTMFADYIAVGAVDAAGRVVRAIVPRWAPGLTVTDDWSGIGQRTTGSGTVTLGNVSVAADDVVAVHAFADRPNLYGPVSQLIHVGIDLGIARAALADTIAFIKTRSRPWIDSGKDTAAEDPLTIAEIGNLRIRLDAAAAMTERAGETIDAARDRLDAATQAEASIAVAEAKVLTSEIAVEAGSKLFELSGTRSVLADLALDRHWRNARTHTLHDPVRWKVHAIGDYHLNGTPPARHAWI